MTNKVVTTYRLTPESDGWLDYQASKQGISKNELVQNLINKAIKDRKIEITQKEMKNFDNR